MKKRVFLVITSFIIFVLCFGISGAETNEKIYLESNKQVVQKGEEIEISVKIQGFETVAYNLYIVFDNDKFEFVSGPENTNVVSNYVVSIWHDINGGISPKSNNLGKFVFKAKENGISDFNISGNFYDTDLKEIQTDFEKLQIRIEAKEEKAVLDELNSNLEMLAIENVMITPLFDNSITNYEAEIGKDEAKLNIFAVPENEKATVQIYGNENLKAGNNLIRIVVKSSNNLNEKEYRVKVYKRNEEEEIKYQTEEELNKQKLENIYQAEKVSLTKEPIENFEEEVSSEIILEETGKSNLIILIILSFATISVVIIIIRKLKNNTKG